MSTPDFRVLAVAFAEAREEHHICKARVRNALHEYGGCDGDADPERRWCCDPGPDRDPESEWCESCRVVYPLQCEKREAGKRAGVAMRRLLAAARKEVTP